MCSSSSATVDSEVLTHLGTFTLSRRGISSNHCRNFVLVSSLTASFQDKFSSHVCWRRSFGTSTTGLMIPVGSNKRWAALRIIFLLITWSDFIVMRLSVLILKVS
uniref:Uncharacterized protein n=1 Tax=Cacopsylla melanoneura TaxID=428564 RepID=A0A8D9E7H7_9HEMI